MKLLLNASLRNAHKLWQKSSLRSSQTIMNEKTNAMQWVFRFSKRQANKLGTTDSCGYNIFYCSVHIQIYFLPGSDVL